MSTTNEVQQEKMGPFTHLMAVSVQDLLDDIAQHFKPGMELFLLVHDPKTPDGSLDFSMGDFGRDTERLIAAIRVLHHDHLYFPPDVVKAISPPPDEMTPETTL